MFIVDIILVDTIEILTAIFQPSCGQRKGRGEPGLPSPVLSVLSIIVTKNDLHRNEANCSHVSLLPGGGGRVVGG